MQNLFSALTQQFIKHKGTLSQEAFGAIIKGSSDFIESNALGLELLKASGYPIEEEDEQLLFKSYFTPLAKERFCIVDIETNGSKPSNSQIIEIGAIMVQDGKEIDRFESLALAPYLPKQISEITGIQSEDLENAPRLSEVLMAFREFLGDAVFVAHNVDFDYGYINASFEREGLGSIGNQTICTIALAQKCFQSQRYGLAYLIESLGIESAVHHRALSDAYCASVVFDKSLKLLPAEIATSFELVRFAKEGKRLY